MEEISKKMGILLSVWGNKTTMSEEAPYKPNNTCKDFLEPKVKEVSISENVRVQILNIEGELTRIGYEIETRKRVRRSFPPALMKIVLQEKVTDDRVTIYKIGVL
jgi:hypothetical protein